MAERKPRMKVQTPISQSHVFKIERILPSYSFSVGNLRHSEGDYIDYNHTEIEATCLVPPKHFGRMTKFTLLGDRGIVDQMQKRSPPGDYIPGVATLTMRKDRSEYLGSIPSDAAFSIMVLALVQGLKFIYFAGEAAGGGKVKINYISFSNEFDPDDY